MSRASIRLVRLSVDIPDCPATISKKLPLSELTGAGPPQLKNIEQRDNPNGSSRQRWFEENVLQWIAEALGTREIPWQFRMRSGELRQTVNGEH